MFILIVFLVSSCTSDAPESFSYVPADLSAVIVSDLHYMEPAGFENHIAPLSEYMPETLQTLLNQIIAEKPDVLIMTGDNTNSGKTGEFHALASFIARIAKEGIQPVIIPGNHDIHGIPQEYAELIVPLLSPLSRDKETMSYTAEAGNVIFLAMDDSSFLKGQEGKLPDSTMKWLQKQLEDANRKQRIIIFLSHYSLLSGSTEHYRIQNEDLLILLESHGVQLCFSGHQHAQRHLVHNSLHELISSSLPSFPCLFGKLEIQGTRLQYHTESLDFEQFAPNGFAETAASLQEAHTVSQSRLYHSLLAEIISDEQTLKQSETLLNTFFSSYTKGQISLTAKDIKTNGAYPALKEALKDTNYGPWIESVLETDRYDASSFAFTYGH